MVAKEERSEERQAPEGKAPRVKIKTLKVERETLKDLTVGESRDVRGGASSSRTIYGGGNDTSG